MATDGRGATGKVYKEFRNGQWAAVKKVPGVYMTPHDMDREIEIYNQTAEHANIVHLVERPIMHWDYMWHIPMEYIFGESLQKIMFHHRKSTIQLTPVIVCKIITGMCEGLLYMHSKDIVHQDLKPDNIMVENNTYRAVIIDLGYAKFWRDGLSSAPNRGNIAYAAPEVRGFPLTDRDKRSDVWALGKIIAELLMGYETPTMHGTPRIEVALNGNVFCDPVRRMLDGCPIARATMAQVIGEIRAAEKIAIEQQSLSAPTYSSSRSPHSLAPQQYQRSREDNFSPAMFFNGLGLPPDFCLSKPLPPYCTVKFTHATGAEGGRPASFEQASVKFSNGKFVEGWHAKVTDYGNALVYKDD